MAAPKTARTVTPVDHPPLVVTDVASSQGQRIDGEPVVTIALDLVLGPDELVELLEGLDLPETPDDGPPVRLLVRAVPSVAAKIAGTVGRSVLLELDNAQT